MRRFLITAGPTREYLDPVRFLSNGSTGRTGFLIAEVAYSQGNEVILVTGPTHIQPPEGPEIINVISAEQMAQAVLKHLQWADVLIGTAAVCDWRPQKTFKHKLPKKQKALLEINWINNPDILLLAGKEKTRERNTGAKKIRLHIGFALEDENGEQKAKSKLKSKNLDYIVLNGPENIGGEKGTYQLISKTGKAWNLNTLTKRKLAEVLVDLSTTGTISLKNL